MSRDRSMALDSWEMSRNAATSACLLDRDHAPRCDAWAVDRGALTSGTGALERHWRFTDGARPPWNRRRFRSYPTRAVRAGSADPADSADPSHIAHGTNAHRLSGAGRVDHHPAADVHADVMYG